MQYCPAKKFKKLRNPIPFFNNIGIQGFWRGIENVTDMYDTNGSTKKSDADGIIHIADDENEGNGY